MAQWMEQLATWLNLEAQTVTRLVQSLIVLLVILLIKIILVRVIRHNVKRPELLYRLRRAINYTAGIVALLIIGRIWFEGVRDIGVLLGLAAAGLAIALKEPVLCLAGWLFLLLRRPYVVGDRIQVGEVFGDVIDIRMFQTYLLECGQWVDADQSTGRIVMLPNSAVFEQPVINFTHGFQPIWDELTVTITFESDWKKAKQLLQKLADEHAAPYCTQMQKQIRQQAGEHLIYYGKLTPIVYTTVRENGIALSVRYLVPPRARRSMCEQLWESILEALAGEPTIQWAYPTTRFFDRHQEPNPHVRPAPPR